MCTNFINGILNQLVWNSDLDSNFEWFDSDFQGILLNSTSYISWAISSGRILERPDIGMLYYPSLYNFYWFSSRVSSIFEEPKMIPLMKRFPVLSQMKEMWQKTSRTHVTSQIFSLMTTEGEFVYWEGFLGLSDTTLYSFLHLVPFSFIISLTGIHFVVWEGTTLMQTTGFSVLQSLSTR